MSTLSLPYPNFVNGQVADANQVDANNTAISNIINGGIDHINIGSAGIYASQIIPTAAFQAQFGGAFGYNFQPNTAGQVPLTVTGTSGQTADLFDVFAGTNKLAYIDKSGNFFAVGATFSGPISVTGLLQAGSVTLTGTLTGVAANFSGGVTAASVQATGNILSTTGNLIAQAGNVQANATGNLFKNLGVNGAVFQTAADGNAALLCVNNAANSASIFRVDSIDATHGQAVVNRGGVLGVLLPVLTAAGGQVASTAHCVAGTITAAGASTTITLAGSAAFTAGQAWVYYVFDATAGTLVTTLSGLSNTGFTFASTSGHVYMYFAIGV